MSLEGKVGEETGGHEVSAQQRAVEEDLVERVVRSFDGCEDVRLTEQEWDYAIDFLTRVRGRDLGEVVWAKARFDIVLASGEA